MTAFIILFIWSIIVIILALSITCLPTVDATLSPSSTAAVKTSAKLLSLRKNVISGAAVFTAGDAAAQHYTSRKEVESSPMDTERLTSSACIGAVWSGIIVPNLYTAAENILPGRSKSRILGKMCITCGILSTGGNYITMLSRRMIQLGRGIEGGPTSVQDCIQSCNRDIPHVIADDLKLWPMYDIMCFSVIPPKLRAFTTAIMSSSWAMYISIVSARDVPTKE